MNPDNPLKYSKSTRDSISFLVRNPGYCVDLLSAEYGFSREMLVEYADVLNWELVSSNTNIKWDFDLLYTFYDRISWGKLSVNRAAFNDVSLLSIFSEKIRWKDEGIEYGSSIGWNEGLPWTVEFIKKYESKIDFHELSCNESVKWSEELLDRYWEKLDLYELVSNEAIHWDLRLFDKFLGKEYIDCSMVNCNPGIFSDINLVEKYKDKVDWYYVCINPDLPWAEKGLLDCWEKYLNWFGLCQNRALFEQDPFFYYDHCDRWDSDKRYYELLSNNPFLPWSKDFISRFSTRLDWEALSQNESVGWTAELIDCFANRVCWGGVYDEFITEDARGNPIDPIPSKSFQYGLLSNNALPWSIKFLTRYESNIGPYSKQQSPEIWNKVFKPVIDDKVLGILMRLV